MEIFNDLESSVRCYSRSFPVVFDKASGSCLFDEHGKRYIDFLAGAGSLNYGHNNPLFKDALVDYIRDDGITHSLDMQTRAKAEFMKTFQELILEPRQLNYRLQFTGPTGTNAVEAALKVARKVKGRANIIAFTNGFHGVSLGAVAATGNRLHRKGAGVALNNVTRMPYCGYLGKDVDTLMIMDRMLGDTSSGVARPAAVLVETVQGEGGLNVATRVWLQKLEKICRKHDMLLIVDDIQAGCGRTGTFFSFEPSGIQPDIVTLSKSLSGYGLPFALVLLKPELDCWEPGEHNGTFRGNNHAFVTARAAIGQYWKDDRFSRHLDRKAALLEHHLKDIAVKTGTMVAKPKGRGLMQGLAFPNGKIAGEIVNEAFENGLVIETSGNQGQVVKCLCPLTIREEELNEGLSILKKCVREALKDSLSLVS